MKLRKLNSKGFGHQVLLAFVVVGMAAAGVYALVGSHAQVPPPDNSNTTKCGKVVSNNINYGGMECPSLKYPRNTVLVTDSNAANRYVKLVFQSDGNLVAYYQNTIKRWASGTAGKVTSTGYIALQSDGNMVIYTGGSSNKAVWASGTNRANKSYFTLWCADLGNDIQVAINVQPDNTNPWFKS